MWRLTNLAHDVMHPAPGRPVNVWPHQIPRRALACQCLVRVHDQIVSAFSESCPAATTPRVVSGPYINDGISGCPSANFCPPSRSSRLYLHTTAIAFITMSNKPIIAVTGASGFQGGSVVRFLLKDGGFHIRALTRKVDSDAAKGMSPF